MEASVRDECLQDVVTASHGLVAHAAPFRTRSARMLFADFEATLPAPKNALEQALVQAMLVESSLRWGHADHWAYHAEFPDADCSDDPVALAMTLWHDSPADPKAAWRRWTAAYLAQMERIHPRYRAMELRRDLDANFAQRLSVSTLARTRGVPIRFLQRDFQELTGMTVRQYVIQRRLDAAVTLLKNTPDKVEWIANVVGWSSRKNFNRALARQRGVQPTALRGRYLS